MFIFHFLYKLWIYLSLSQPNLTIFCNFLIIYILFLDFFTKCQNYVNIFLNLFLFFLEFLINSTKLFDYFSVHFLSSSFIFTNFIIVICTHLITFVFFICLALNSFFLLFPLSFLILCFLI